MKLTVNYAASIELDTKTIRNDKRLTGRFYNSNFGLEQGDEYKTQPITQFKVINGSIYAETRANVYHIRSLNPTSLAKFNTLDVPVYTKPDDIEFDTFIAGLMKDDVQQDC